MGRHMRQTRPPHPPHPTQPPALNTLPSETTRILRKNQFPFETKRGSNDFSENGKFWPKSSLANAKGATKDRSEKKSGSDNAKNSSAVSRVVLKTFSKRDPDDVIEAIKKENEALLEAARKVGCRETGGNWTRGDLYKRTK